MFRSAMALIDASRNIEFSSKIGLILTVGPDANVAADLLLTHTDISNLVEAISVNYLRVQVDIENDINRALRERGIRLVCIVGNRTPSFNKVS